jgi:succinate dehydrogenase / fumarate reductase membrane anchor subunit
MIQHEREAVGAHYGIGGWLVQRVGGAIVAVYVIVLLAILFRPGMDIAGWQNVFHRTSFRLATFVALMATFAHAWVGMRDILMDYLRATSVRLTAEILVIVALAVYTGWTIQILWGLH